MKSNRITFAILLIALMGISAFSCKKPPPPPPPPPPPVDLIGIWNTINKDTVNVDAGVATAVILAAIEQLGIKFPPTMIFNADKTGSFVDINGISTPFTYTKTDKYINFTVASGFSFGPISLSSFSLEYVIVSKDKTLRLYLDATELVKAFLISQGGAIATLANMIKEIGMTSWYQKK